LKLVPDHAGGRRRRKEKVVEGSYGDSRAGVGAFVSSSPLFFGEAAMLITILLIVLLLSLVGSVPVWPHSRSWGYYPSGGVGLVLVILLVLFLMGRL
jgi:Protein of unknown function (DUF3309)